MGHLYFEQALSQQMFSCLPGTEESNKITLKNLISKKRSSLLLESWVLTDFAFSNFGLPEIDVGD